MCFFKSKKLQKKFQTFQRKFWKALLIYNAIGGWVLSRGYVSRAWVVCITFFYWMKIDSGRRRGRQWERRTSQWMCKTRLCGPLLNLTACKDYKGRSNQSKKDNILTYTTRTHLSIQRRISLEGWSIYAEKIELSAFSFNRKLVVSFGFWNTWPFWTITKNKCC